MTTMDTIYTLVALLAGFSLGPWIFWSALKNKASFMNEDKAKTISMFIGNTGPGFFICSSASRS